MRSRSSGSRSGGSSAARTGACRIRPSDGCCSLSLYLALMMFHPLTNGLLAGVAQTMLYCRHLLRGVLGAGLRRAPAAARADPRDPAGLQRDQLRRRRAAGLRPGPLDAARAVVRYTGSRTAMDIATYIGPDGQAHRPAAGAVRHAGRGVRRGTVAALLGLVFALERFAWWKRLGALGLSLAGISAIYLSHVRASLVVTRRDDGGLRRDPAPPGRAQAPDRLRRPGRRAGRRRLDGLGRAGRPVDPGAVLDAARRTIPDRSTTARAASSSATGFNELRRSSIRSAPGWRGGA